MFKVGDYVEIIGNSTIGVIKGNVYEVSGVGDGGIGSVGITVHGNFHAFDPINFKPSYPQKEAGVAAPPLAIQHGGTHYKKLKIQPVEYIMANSIPYMEGNVIKYCTRWKDKGGIEDLKKAKHYLEILIENEQKND